MATTWLPCCSRCSTRASKRKWGEVGTGPAPRVWYSNHCSVCCRTLSLAARLPPHTTPTSPTCVRPRVLLSGPPAQHQARPSPMPPKRAPAPAHARIGARAAAAASAAAPALYSFAGLLAALMAAVRMLLGWVVMEAKDKVRGRVARVDARPFFLQGAPPVQGARRARGFNSLGTPSAGRLCPLSLMQSAQKPRKVVLQPVERGTEREHGHAGAGQRRRRKCFMRAARRAPGALLSLRSHPLSRSRLLSHTDTPRAPISLSPRLCRSPHPRRRHPPPGSRPRRSRPAARPAAGRRPRRRRSHRWPRPCLCPRPRPRPPCPPPTAAHPAGRRGPRWRLVSEVERGG